MRKEAARGCFQAKLASFLQEKLIRDSLTAKAAAGDPGFREIDRTRYRCVRIHLRGFIVYFRERTERERGRTSEVRNTHTHTHGPDAAVINPETSVTPVPVFI